MAQWGVKMECPRCGESMNKEVKVEVVLEDDPKTKFNLSMKQGHTIWKCECGLELPVEKTDDQG